MARAIAFQNGLIRFMAADDECVRFEKAVAPAAALQMKSLS